MTAPYHLIAFWDLDKEKDLPAIGSRIETTLKHNYSASLFPHPEKPLSVLVESHSMFKLEEKRDFFGRLDSKDLSQEQLQQYKKFGLFQLAISNQSSQDPMLPLPPPLIRSRGTNQNRSQMRVFCTTPTSDYQRFEQAYRVADAADGGVMGDWLTQRKYVSGRQDWQAVDYAQEWFRELKDLHDNTATSTDDRIRSDPQVLNVDFDEIFFILLGDNRNEEDSARDIVTVVVQMAQDQRKDPIRTYRCTIACMTLCVAGDRGYGDRVGWHENLMSLDDDQEPVLECPE